MSGTTIQPAPIITTAGTLFWAIIRGRGFVVAHIGKGKACGADSFIARLAQTGGNAIINFAAAMVRAGHFKAGIGR